MESIYEKNLKAYKLRYPHLTSKIIEKIENSESTISTITPLIEEASDHSKILKVINEGKEWSLNSKYFPEASVDNWMKQFPKIEYMATFVMFGIGNGLYVKRLLEETEETVHILVYEPSRDIFEKVIRNIDMSALFNERVYIVVNGLNQEELYTVHSAYVNYSNMGISKYISYPNYEKIFPEKYKEYYEKIRTLVGRIAMDRNTDIYFSKSVTLNSMKNMKHIFTNSTVDQLKGRVPKDIPAIVVAAGPSLNKNIHELKKAKNKALIIATDTAVKPMLKAGILPDVFVTIDAQKPLILFDDERIAEIPISAVEMSNTKIIEGHKGKKFFANGGNGYIKNIFKKYGKEYSGLETGGSVANNAFSLAEQIGITKIILVGQDLAYTDNKSHADGTFEDKIKETTEYNEKKYAEVEDIHGNMVKTLVNLKYYKEWFEKKIVTNKELKVIDATEGGARIIGTEIIDLKDAIARECQKEVDLMTIIGEVPNIFNPKEIDEISKYVVETPRKLDEIKKKAIAGIKDYKKLQVLFEKRKFDSNDFKKVTKKIKRLTKYMEETPEIELILPYIKLVDFQVSSDIFETEDNIADEGTTIAAKGILMLQAIKQGIEELEPEIKMMAESVKGEEANVK